MTTNPHEVYFEAVFDGISFLKSVRASTIKKEPLVGYNKNKLGTFCFNYASVQTFFGPNINL